MDEQTHPSAGVEQAPSIEDRAEALASRLLESPDEQEEQPERQAEAAQEQDTEGLDETDSDPETEEVEQPQVDSDFEIVHDGAQVKLTRAEAIQYARQGFDYTQKTQRLAEKDRYVEGQLRTLQEVDQVRPHLQQQEGVVKALEMQLRQYQGVNWVEKATEDPIGYSQLRAQYDQLRDHYAQANQEYQNGYQYVKQRVDHVQAQRLQAEIQRIPDLIPEWKDSARRSKDEQEITKHYATQYGVSEQDLRAGLQGQAFPLAIVYKAMKWDQLQKGKTEKVKQLRTAPPVTVPGAKSTTAKADKDTSLRDRLKKTGDRYDAAAVLLNRMK